MRTNIKKLREKNNWTQKQLADKLGLRQVIISHYENDRRYPSVPIVLKMAELFQVSTDEVLNRKNYTPQPPTGSDETNNDTMKLPSKITR